MPKDSPKVLQPIPAWQFSLGGILLVITLIGVCLACWRLAPYPGVLLSIACAPAAIRTAMTVRHYARLGERMSMTEKVADFALSLFVVLCIEIAASFAAMAGTTVFGGLLKFLFGLPDAYDAALLPGGTIGLLVFLGLMWRLRPRTRKEPGTDEFCK